MLKRSTLFFFFLVLISAAKAQITIISSDVTNGGESILTSVANTAGSSDPSLTGANYNWDFSALTPAFQRYEIFNIAGSYTGYYNLLYGSFGVPTTYGQNNFTASLLPIPGFTVTSAYDFYKKSTANLKKVGLAYTLNDSIPLPFEYTQPDVVYKFPINYLNIDSCDFKFQPHHLIPAGTLPFYYGGAGHRVNEVDGWGTLITPFGTFSTLRIKSVITETDTINSTFGGYTIPLPTRIEYKWLTAGIKIPVLQIDENIVGGIPQVTSIVYPDSLRTNVPYVGIKEKSSVADLTIYPNPSADQFILKYNLISNANVKISIINMLGKTLAVVANGNSAGGEQFVIVKVKDLNLAPGIYFVNFESNGNKVVKKIIVEK